MFDKLCVHCVCLDKFMQTYGSEAPKKTVFPTAYVMIHETFYINFNPVQRQTKDEKNVCMWNITAIHYGFVGNWVNIYDVRMNKKQSLYALDLQFL